MGNVYTIAGGKGGVGKTTTAINLGLTLQQRDHDVVVVDGDLGMTNLGAMLGVEFDASVHDVLAERASLADALVDGPSGLTVLPGDERLEAFVDADPSRLGRVVDELRRRFDTVLVDTGVGLCEETVAPIRVADAILLVTTPGDVAIGDTRKMIDLAGRVDTRVLGTVVTRAETETNVSALAEGLDTTVLAAVPADEAVSAVDPVVVESPDSDAAEAYETLARKIETYVEARAAP